MKLKLSYIQSSDIIWGVKNFIEYLYGRHFTLVTDNKVLIISILVPGEFVCIFCNANAALYIITTEF